MLVAIIGLSLGVALGAALLYVGGMLRVKKGILARVVGILISFYGAILIAVSLYALITL